VAEAAPCDVALREVMPPAMLNLRGDPDEEFRHRVAATLGVAPPVVAGTWRRQGGVALYWLGPGEWLAVAAEGAAGDLERRLRGSLRGRFAVTDVSGGHILYQLCGSAGRQVLSKLGAYDFHPGNFPPGRCAQTTLAKAGALVAANADGSFDLVVRRSYAAYLRDWLADAAGEYGLAAVSGDPR